MKITILNGSPEPGTLDNHLDQLNHSLQSAGHTLIRINLRELALRYCIGCWGCWVKTPGQCSSRDASIEMDRAVINADFVLWAAPLKMGFPSALLKMALDKHLPLIHPYMVVDRGEAHHLRRYPRSPRVGLLLEKEPSTNIEDLLITSDILCRTALNFKTRLEFTLTTETPITELVALITARKPSILPLPARLAAVPGNTIQPPARLTLFNGSPRGRRGNTPLMLEKLAEGFGRPTDTYHLVRVKETDQMVKALAEAECAIIGFPLYTDAMPGIVKHFIEALEPLVGRRNNPPIGFLVQSGFPEALHSRYIERYVEKLAARLGSPYLGTIVKGGGEGIRMMPPEANKSLFKNLTALGAGLAANGQLDTKLIQAIATPEKFPAILWPVLQVFIRLPIARMYFDNMLKENGVYDQRFSRPFSL